MQARMRNIATIFPDAMKALYALRASAEKSGMSACTIGLVQLRASQINGCSVCVDMHARHLKQAGETDERLFAVAARGALFHRRRTRCTGAYRGRHEAQ